MVKARPTDSGLPRRQPGQALDASGPPEGVKHPHAEGTPTTDEHGEHLHRLGLIPHDHDDDGRPVFHAVEARFQPAQPPDTTDQLAAVSPSATPSLPAEIGSGDLLLPSPAHRPDAAEAVLGGGHGRHQPFH